MTGETRQEILPPDDGATPYRYRHDGWTPARQSAFLHALREGGCLREACAHVGLSRTSLARARRRLPSFGDAVDLALEYRAPALERAALTRAVDGWDEPVFHGGKLVGHRRRYSDALLRLLMQRADAAAARTSARHAAIVSPADTNKAIMRALEKLRPRLQRERRAAAIAMADRLVAEGKAP